MSEPGGLIWVCVDCMLAHHGYTPEEIGREYQIEPWALWDAPIDVTAGGVCVADEACDRGECECDVMSFSWSDCEGCGSWLGGERHAFTYWTGDRA